MVYLAFFCTILLFLLSFLARKAEGKKAVQSRLASVFNQNPKGKGMDEDQEHETFWKRIGAPAWAQVKRNFKRNMKRKDAAKLEIKLLQAGSPMGMGPVEYRIIKITLFLILPLLGFMYGEILDANSGVIVILIIAALFIASVLPGFYLKSKTKARNQQALRELPDILDLLTVSLEAGLGFDSALGKVVSRKNGVLCDEFHRCLEEIRLGKTRRDGLSGVRDRLTVNELRVLISNILQAEKLGIGLVKVLRIQSEEVREQRKQRAEETAMKAPIKMLFPLVLFIFPSLFIVLLGPAVMQFLSAFSKQ